MLRIKNENPEAQLCTSQQLSKQTTLFVFDIWRQNSVAGPFSD